MRAYQQRTFAGTLSEEEKRDLCFTSLSDLMVLPLHIFLQTAGVAHLAPMVDHL